MPYEKSIQYDREIRDYAMFLDGELVGFARSYHEAEIALDQMVYELLSDGHFASATELDGGTDDNDPLPDPGPEGPGVPGDDRPLIADCLNVVTMALGHTYGAASVVSELQRLKTRLEAAAVCDAARM